MTIARSYMKVYLVRTIVRYLVISKDQTQDLHLIICYCDIFDFLLDLIIISLLYLSFLISSIVSLS